MDGRREGWMRGRKREKENKQIGTRTKNMKERDTGYMFRIDESYK